MRPAKRPLEDCGIECAHDIAGTRDCGCPCHVPTNPTGGGTVGEAKDL